MASISALARPLLPPPPSWYPGHMSVFAKALPGLLTRTDIVLELRDARLPLTSINGTLEVALQRWKQERGRSMAVASGANMAYSFNRTTCERIVVFNKRDLVPEWGLEPFRKAMQARLPDQRVLFASWHRQKDIKALNKMLLDIAAQNPYVDELNVLVVGMPNVGKSTLLNALRNIGISGPVAKALKTSPTPGMTRSLSTRLKISQDPLIYSFDSPGVMLPYLGRGEAGAERGTKLALIAGLKEGLYDTEVLASYLLYRFNVLDPISPAYLKLLPPGSAPTQDADAFLDTLATRMGMIGRGGKRDLYRAASWFVRWWREEGALLSASAPVKTEVSDDTAAVPRRRGWGFDIEWIEEPGSTADVGEDALQARMEEAIDSFMVAEKEEMSEGGATSTRQIKLRDKAEQRAKSEVRVRALLAARKGAGGSGSKSKSKGGKGKAKPRR